MVNKRFLTAIIAFVTSCVLPLAASSQNLPLLPPDPAIKTGVLPNGTSWYIASNSPGSSRADFALVRNNIGCNFLDDSTKVAMSRASLSHLRHFSKGRTPQEFLLSHGAEPGTDGFVRVGQGATVYHFPRMILSDEKSVTDSTLLLIYDIIDNYTPFFENGLAGPSDFAIVVSGDVDARAIETKLYYMSLGVNGFPDVLHQHCYMWTPEEGTRYSVQKHEAGLPGFTLSWRLPRTSDELVGTIQPAIMELIMNELGEVAADAVKRDSLPLWPNGWKYVPSRKTLSDESFSFSVSTSQEELEGAMKSVFGMFSAVRDGSVTVEDFTAARRETLRRLSYYANCPVKPDADIVDRCVSSFLYGSPTTTMKQKRDFFTSRDIADTTELRLFNTVVRAMLSDTANLTVTLRENSGTYDSDSLKTIFEDAWKSGSYTALAVTPDTPAAAELVPFSEKFKVISSKEDKTSGSSVWTFMNGFTVVYKYMPTSDMLYYSLSLGGGYGDIDTLAPGTGGFVGDYLGLCRINGCPAPEFFRSLEKNGITMSSRVSMSDMEISGQGPCAKADMLMNALISVFNFRERDSLACSSYLRDMKFYEVCLPSSYLRMREIDRVMCPDNMYTSYRYASALDDKFFDRVEAFYRRQSFKMDDGVLVVAGDIDPTRFRKMLLGYVRYFDTEQRAFRRSAKRYQTTSGISTYTVRGDENVIDITMSAHSPYTAENVYACALVRMFLTKHFSARVAPVGMKANVSVRNTLEPQERVNMKLTVRMADVNGFAEGVSHVDMIGALNVVRSAVAALPDEEIDEKELAAWKNDLKCSLKAEMTSPSWWVKAISDRYIYGKDLYSNALSRIDSVSAEKLKSIVATLLGGSRVEYVITDVN